MSIFRDIEFTKARSVLTKKMQQLKSVGLGNKPRKAQVLGVVTINKMYDAKTLGGCNPRALIHSMWLICTQYFGMRTGKECRDLCWGDVQLCFDEGSGTEYLMLDKERQTKTRTGANPRDTRIGKPKAWATNVDQRCPVSLYKMYKEKRPSDLSNPDSPFFLTPGNSYHQCWFKKTPIGINKMYNILNEMKADAGIEAPRITPYSSRKRLLTRLCDEDIPVNQIIQVSGHKNVNSVNNYSRMNDEQSKKISDILSDTETANKSKTNLDVQVRSEGPASSYQSGMGLFSHWLFANSHFHGPVSIHFNNTSVSENQTLSQISAVTYNSRSTNHVASPVIRPAYKRICMIESDDSD